MTPKEKANELMQEYVNNMPLPLHIEDAKICALIAVEEVWRQLEAARVFEEYDYWQEVKKEIKRL